MVATIAGIYTVRSYNIPVNVFYPNIAAVVMGVLISIGIILKWHHVLLAQIKILSLLTFLLLLSSFLFPAQENVHRWITVASFKFNVSMLVIPIILFCLHCFLRSENFLYAIFLFVSTGVILTVQPDAGQATSFALAALILFAINKSNFALLLGILITSLMIIMLSWQRVDLLEPVDYVEEILYMIRGQGPVGYSALLVTGIFIFYPFLRVLSRQKNPLPLAYIIYLLSSFAVTEFGHYPVPLLGAGASAVIGWYLMLGFAFKV